MTLPLPWNHLVVVTTLVFLYFAKPAISANLAHPLDPLTQDEIRTTRNVIYLAKPSLKTEGEWVFNWITLKEPPKDRLLTYFLLDTDPPKNSLTIPRKSLTVLLEKTRNIINEVVVNLNSLKVESWIRVPDGLQVTYSTEDNTIAESLAKEDAQVQERCRQMGWTNMSLVFGETWSAAYRKDRPVLAKAIRPIQLYMYGSNFEGDNQFAHPFDFVVTVDLALKKVIAIDNLPTHSDYDADNRNGNVCPRQEGNFRPDLLPDNFYRTDVHPIHFSQPHGPSYQIRGNEVSWQKFKFRIGFNGREGLVLHHVSYKDGNKRRPLFYRLSVGELFVPYGDARPPFHQKFPFDEAEFTLGYNAIDLKTAGICKGGIAAYLDVPLNNEQGDPYNLPSAVCIHEVDEGLLWTHWDRKDKNTYHARKLVLVITCYSNLGNYDYKLSWRFSQDATIEFNVQLHGLVSSQLLAQNVTSAGDSGTIVSPLIDGQFHQHIFGLRIDPEIDGPTNSASILDVVPLPDPAGSPRNPYGQGFTVVEKLLRTPLESQTKISAETARSWMIRNPYKIHPVTKRPVGWKLIPHNAPLSFVKKDSVFHSKAAWLDHNFSVTEYKDGQFYPAGFYLDDNNGLPQWIKADPKADITHTDIVLWYNFGITHLPRTEDWPIMPVESTSVFLKPMNFFTDNPARDVPPPPVAKDLYI